MELAKQVFAAAAAEALAQTGFHKTLVALLRFQAQSDTRSPSFVLDTPRACAQHKFFQSLKFAVTAGTYSRIPHTALLLLQVRKKVLR